MLNYLRLKERKNMIKKGLIDIIQLELNHQVNKFKITAQEVRYFLYSYDYELFRYQVKNNKLIKLQKDFNFNSHSNYFAIRDIRKVNNILSNYIKNTI